MALSTCSGETLLDGREDVSHGTKAFPAAAYHDELDKLAVPMHWHDEMELLVVLKGPVAVPVGTERIPLKRGEGMFINSGMLHAVDAESGELHSIVFHPSLPGGAEGSVFYEKTIKALDGMEYALFSSGTPIMSLFNEAWESLVRENGGYENRVRYLLSEILSMLPKERTSFAKQDTLESGRMKNMLSFISNHYAEDVTLEEIASSASISVGTCLRTFKKFMSKSPIKFLNEYRLGKASEMLSSSDLNVVDVASLCGFSDESYFIRSFSSMFSMTPGAYRKRMATKQNPLPIA